MRRPSRWFAPLLAAPLMLAAACKTQEPKKGDGAAQTEPVKPVEPPDDPLPALRSGAKVPGAHADIAATIAGSLLNERDAGSFARDVVRL